LTGLANNLNGSAITFDYTQYDKVSNRLQCSIDGGQAQEYTYNKIYEVNYVKYHDVYDTEDWYDYDKLGNRTYSAMNEGNEPHDWFEIYYDSNALNQYKTVDGTNYEYDKNGNLTNDGAYIYIYDCENRLIQVKQGETVIATYAYDFAGRRAATTTGGATRMSQT
jgi:YD repeat-containing protein